MNSRTQIVKDLIFNSPRRIYYTGKKALFMLCLVTGLSLYFPTFHDGGILDRIWSSLYWSGPVLLVLTASIMILAAWKESGKPTPGEMPEIDDSTHL